MSTSDVRPLVVTLSGLSGSGKTTFARLLEHDFRFEMMRTRDLITARLVAGEPFRSDLIQFGDALDVDSAGKWIADEAQARVEAGSLRLCVDRLRKPCQLVWFKRNPSWKAVHVHFTADQRILQRRYKARAPEKFKEDLSFEALMASDANFSEELEMEADLRVVDDNIDWPQALLALGLLRQG